MKLRRTCRDVTRLVLEGEDRALTRGERAALALHLPTCSACPRFVRQARFMHRALGRWKAYGDDAG